VPKLQQIVAIESGTKTDVGKTLTAIYHQFQRQGAFDGQTRVYESADADGPTFPSESQRVQHQVEELLRSAAEAHTELFDVVATKDTGNMNATASVELDGQVLLPNVPVTYLLFLEKQLKDIKTIIDKLPTLDPAYEWKQDPSGGYRADSVKTTKTQKVAKPIVLAQATKEHPAQTQLISVDEVIGHWNTTKLSGAVAAERKKQLQDRIKQLINAVKFAREQANSIEVDRVKTGEKIFNYLLA